MRELVIETINLEWIFISRNMFIVDMPALARVGVVQLKTDQTCVEVESLRSRVQVRTSVEYETVFTF